MNRWITPPRRQRARASKRDTKGRIASTALWCGFLATVTCGALGYAQPPASQVIPHEKPEAGQGTLEPLVPLAAGGNIVRLVNTAEILKAVIDDLSKLNIFDRQFQRYVWIVPWAHKHEKEAVQFVINSAINGTVRRTLVYPAYVRRDLMRYDLRFFAQNEDQLNDIIAAVDLTFIQDYRFYTVKEIELFDFDQQAIESAQNILDGQALTADRESVIRAEQAEQGRDLLAKSRSRNKASQAVQQKQEPLTELVFREIVITRRGGADLRSNAETLARIPGNTKLSILAGTNFKGKRWLKVEYGGRRGWVDQAKVDLVTVQQRQPKPKSQPKAEPQTIVVQAPDSAAAGQVAIEATRDIAAQFGGRAAVTDLNVIDQDVVLAPHLAFSFDSSLAKLILDNELIPWVCSSDIFVTLASSATNGGTYYDLQLWKKDGVFVVDSDDIFADLGADENIFDNQLRAFMMYSLVTGKRRIVELIQGQVARVNTGAIWITLDRIFDDRDADTDFLYNLLDADEKAQEIIIEQPNGLHAFIAADGDGNLLDFVPQSVAIDTRIPQAGTMPRHGGAGDNFLQPMVSCVRCHGEEHGLLAFENDFFRIAHLDVLDDNFLAQLEPELVLRVEQIFALYGQNALQFHRRLRLGQDDYDTTVERLCGGVTVAEVTIAVASIFDDFQYDLVDAERGLAELGYKAPDSVQALQKLIPPISGGLVAFENPAIGFLKEGLFTDRDSWVIEYQDLALRLAQYAGASGGY